ncbi:unnamed protein product [Cladocopium goreaui]|uniref:UPF0187 protein n=1 Tax=Cladocopium goreaui TaxID=2562237 RepID=A0A9P1C5S4_9DINO|nr:unnamed protein product [Cladocopium goreaui]
MRFVPVVFPLLAASCVTICSHCDKKELTSQLPYIPFCSRPSLPAASFVSRFERQVVWMWQSRAAPRVEVPRPVQLGSLKSENEGQDPGIRLVPAGGGGWGRKKEEDVIEEEEEVPETQNPRLGNLTSQPAQLRPTAWGRSSLSAQAGPRPAPWAQPPPGKVVPEPVPLERRQQEDFPSLGSEPIKGRKSSGSGPSMLSAPV